MKYIEKFVCKFHSIFYIKDYYSLNYRFSSFYYNPPQIPNTFYYTSIMMFQELGPEDFIENVVENENNFIEVWGDLWYVYSKQDNPVSNSEDRRLSFKNFNSRVLNEEQIKLLEEFNTFS